MFQIKISNRISIEPRLDRWINSFYGTMGERWVNHVKRDLIAIVDGVHWTPQQTEEARRTGRMCGCGDCVCCEVYASIRRQQVPEA